MQYILITLLLSILSWNACISQTDDEATYRDLIRIIAQAVGVQQNLARDNAQVCRPGFFLSITVLNEGLNDALRGLVARNESGPAAGNECLALNTQLLAGLDASRKYSNNPIFGTGIEATAQASLQGLGSALNAIFVAGEAAMNATNPGPFKTLVIEIVKDLSEAQRIIENSDSANCLRVWRELGEDLIQVERLLLDDSGSTAVYG